MRLWLAGSPATVRFDEISQERIETLSSPHGALREFRRLLHVTLVLVCVDQSSDKGT